MGKSPPSSQIFKEAEHQGLGAGQQEGLAPGGGEECTELSTHTHSVPGPLEWGAMSGQGNPVSVLGLSQLWLW